MAAQYIEGHVPNGTDEQITVSSTAIGITNGTIANAKACFISVHDQPIRWRAGGDPTTTLGHYETDGDEIILLGRRAMTGFRAIREGGTDAVLFVTFYG